MVKKSLIVLCIIAAVFVCLQLFFRTYLLGFPLITQSVNILYLWSPGLLALYFSWKDGTRLPVFRRPNKMMYLTPVITLGLCLVAFFLTFLTGSLPPFNPSLVSQSVFKTIGIALLLLVTSWLLMSVLFSFIFLGSELYFRGYFWERMKRKKAINVIWLSALLMSLWQTPIMLYSYKSGPLTFLLNLLWVFVLNFAMAPVLTFFRVKTHAVVGSALFYSFLMASFVYLFTLFPSTDLRFFGLTGLFIILGLVGFSLYHKLYSAKVWEKIK